MSQVEVKTSVKEVRTQFILFRAWSDVRLGIVAVDHWPGLACSTSSMIVLRGCKRTHLSAKIKFRKFQTNHGQGQQEMEWRCWWVEMHSVLKAIKNQREIRSSPANVIIPYTADEATGTPGGPLLRRPNARNRSSIERSTSATHDIYNLCSTHLRVSLPVLQATLWTGYEELAQKC